MLGTAGASDTEAGGRAATGGIVGTGGLTGTGGIVGTGGVATGGIVGTGGLTGTGGASQCAMLATMYDAAVVRARTCPLNALVNPCTYSYPSTLACVGACTTYLADSSTVETLLQKWDAANCSATAPRCPACTSPSAGTCQPVVVTQAQPGILLLQTGSCIDSGSASAL